jgi:purine-binding chemotaxis protein CheW
MDTEANILRKRAAALARPVVEVSQEEKLQIVEFALAAETYAFALNYVKKVVPMRAVVPLPGAPAFVLGIIGYMSHIVAVLDLRVFFDLPVCAVDAQQKIVILQVGQTMVALVAESVHGATEVVVSQLQQSLPTLTGVRARYLQGITPSQTIVLDAVALLADEELVVKQ